MIHDTSRWNIDTYNAAKTQAMNCINNNINTIILYGSGNNGKTHLTKELQETLNENNYTIYNPDKSYSWSKDDFVKDMNNITDKKLLHFLFHPFEQWDITCPDKPIEVINMGI